ncbi:MAG: hypothetical protein BGO90_10970 [Legionella sp. 40-6]|nr:diguanylate cyclase [Legionella sp.]OJY48742.1 MAG: hypothetical protein BGO90_10970 [Legionella sp. 40-6]
MHHKGWFHVLPNIIGIVSIILGSAVIWGWYQHYSVLIQIDTKFFPMQFNTAICFLLAGCSLLLINQEYFSLSRLTSSILWVMASLTLAEYLFSINIGIDQLFLKNNDFLSSDTPGRMSANTAFGFFVYSVVTLSISFNLSRRLLVIPLIGCLFIINVGILTLLDYLFHFSVMNSTGAWIHMALHTAFGLIALSVGLLSFIRKRNQLKNLPVFPLLISFLLFDITFIGWQAIKKNQETYFDTMLQTRVENIGYLIDTYFQERISSFSRIGYRWLSQENGTPKSVWQKDVMQYIQDQPGYVAVEWVDSRAIVRWVAPEKQNQRIIGFDLATDAHRRVEIEKSIQQHALHLSPQLDLIQGGKGILIIDPLFQEDRLLGFMIGVMNIQKVFDYLFAKLDLEGIHLTINDRNGILYTNTDTTNSAYSEWSKKIVLKMHGQEWAVTVQPLPKFYNHIMSSTLPMMTLFIGALIAILSGILTESLFSIKKLQNKARNATERLQGIIEGSSDYIAAVDLNSNFIVFNSIYHSEIYRLFHVDLKPGMNLSALYEHMKPENRDKAQILWKKALEGKAFTAIETFEHKHHRDLDYEIHFNPIYDSQGKLIGASHIATNIHRRVLNEQKLVAYRKQLESMVESLERQNKKLQLLKEFSSILQSHNTMDQATKTIKKYMPRLLENTSGTMFMTTPDDADEMRTVLDWGEPMIDSNEIQVNDCLGVLRHQPYYVASTNEDILCKHVEHHNSQPLAYVCLPLFAQKDILGLIYIELTNSSIENQPTIAFSQIISEQISLNLYNIKLNETLKLQSTQDVLTGLSNRRYFTELLQKEMLKSKRAHNNFALILVDIDYFKSINDTYGHQTGDRVLCALAQIMQKELRKSDVIARWGGEEFIICVREISLEKIRMRAEKLRQVVENHRLLIDGETISFTISIGIALFDAVVDKDTLIKKADDALYQAKKSGRNKIIINAYDQIE